MVKRCTNSKCRKNFSTLYFTGRCPYCGKEYPGIPKYPGKDQFKSFLTDEQIRMVKAYGIQDLRTFENELLRDVLKNPGNKTASIRSLRDRTGMSPADSELLAEQAIRLVNKEKQKDVNQKEPSPAFSSHQKDSRPPSKAKNIRQEKKSPAKSSCSESSRSPSKAKNFRNQKNHPVIPASMKDQRPRQVLNPAQIRLLQEHGVTDLNRFVSKIMRDFLMPGQDMPAAARWIREKTEISLADSNRIIKSIVYAYGLPVR